jgi:hypothetical protein
MCEPMRCLHFVFVRSVFVFVQLTLAAASNSSSYESLQCQVVGRRRVLLVSPDQSYKAGAVQVECS